MVPGAWSKMGRAGDQAGSRVFLEEKSHIILQTVAYHLGGGRSGECKPGVQVF